MTDRDPGERQPVHTVYGGAHLFRGDTARRLGDRALRALATYAPDADALGTAVGLEEALHETVYERVVRKLETEPVEDFRIDFEDGYGNRPDDEEDACAAAAAAEVAGAKAAGTLPPFIGIRIKPYDGASRRRADRTLEIFLSTMVAGSGVLPDDFVVTLPKVSEPEQVRLLEGRLGAIERAVGLDEGAVKVELMVELPEAIIGPTGTSPLPALVGAAAGRCVAAHFGVYDYTAAVGITAEHQSLVHPACDFARHVMQVALAGTGVMLSDGATNVIPVAVHRAGADGSEPTPAQMRENREAFWSAWRLHYEHVRHSLKHGYYQGWDLNPAQLPTRYAAVYAFFLESLPSATRRLRNLVAAAARATLEGDVFDDAATGQGLLNFFLRGLSCGAITEREATATGLSLRQLQRRSFT